jgi:hypothetical protein
MNADKRGLINMATKKNYKVFEGIVTGTREMIQSLRGEKRLTARKVIPAPSAGMLAARRIKKT